MQPDDSYGKITHERPRVVGYYTRSLVHLVRHTSSDPQPKSPSHVVTTITATSAGSNVVSSRRNNAEMMYAPSEPPPMSSHANARRPALVTASTGLSGRDCASVRKSAAVDL